MVAKLLLLALMSIPFPSAMAQDAGNPTNIDFSYAGYGGGGEALPLVPAMIRVKPTGGDDTALLQSALNHVAMLPMQSNHFRGAVLLEPGRYLIDGQLHLSASGVVFRGSGQSSTTLIASGKGRRALLLVDSGHDPTLGQQLHIVDAHISAGARILTLDDLRNLHEGTRLEVQRPSTAAWIKAHSMSGLLQTFADQRLDWKPGSHDLVWDRTIVQLDREKKQVTLDAPLTFAIEKNESAATLAIVEADPPLFHIGIESLTLESSYDKENPKDEEHAWIAIELDHVEDAWVRHITARHFVSAAVMVGHHGRRITIEDSRSEAPVSEIGGYRRQSFLLYGQQVLVNRCYSEAGMNDFATGLLASGPNVFLNSQAKGSLEPSGSFEGLAAGVLYENVRVPDSKIQLLLDPSRAQAAGWTAVNSLLWNDAAQSVDALGPYDGYNYVVESAEPLYTRELSARGLSLPPSAPESEPRDENPVAFNEVHLPPQPVLAQHPFSIVNGRFVIDGQIAYGGTQNESFWHGNTTPGISASISGSSVTRFMPGQVAPGLTEDLHELADRVESEGNVFYQMMPGLWYDHRRDEHTVFRQQTGDVWAPFFEMPWARSGKGIAWDGLSRFDLSRFNPWYFERQRGFTRIAGEHGLIVYENVYNTHNVLEIGPHWIDYPWRPANNINKTSIPEPPPFKSGHTFAQDTVQPKVTKVNLANEFYSIDDASQRKLHHDFIMHVLDELGDMPNVIFTVAYQYAGPLAFQQFFLDTVAEWEAQHHTQVRVALVTSKGITDAILNDPVRSKQIAVVDMRYWYYLPSGELFAPEAGQNRSYRDMIADRFGEDKYTNSGPPTTPQAVYKQVREYRDRYPQIALVASENGGGSLPILMAGGAAPTSMRLSSSHEDAVPSQDSILSDLVHREFSHDLMNMSPVDNLLEPNQASWALADTAQRVVLIESSSGRTFTLQKPLSTSHYTGTWINPQTGKKVPAEAAFLDKTTISKPDEGDWLLLLRASN